MASQRTFYRTILQVEVLSETPYNETDLEQVAYDIRDGNQSGKVSILSANEEMNGRTAAIMLKEQVSDPEFFQLDAHGNDLIDDDDEEEKEDDHRIRKMRD